jgi:hypothetical protein
VEEKLQVKNLHKEREILDKQSKEYIKKPSLHLKANSEERHLQGGHQIKGMKMFFMVIASHVINMVTKIWIADIMKGKMLEGSITP